MPPARHGLVLAIGLLAAACASGTDTGNSGGGGGSGGTATGTTGTGSTTGTPTGTSTGTTPNCGATQHLCGGICTDNTPESGCYGSSSCEPCPSPANGAAICSEAGVCDVTCNDPYVKSGSHCECPTECCIPDDCTDEDTECVEGACVDLCVKVNCIAKCLLEHGSDWDGWCKDAYTCECCEGPCPE